MWLPLTLLAAAAALALAGWAGWRAAADRPVIWRQVLVGAGVEAVLVVETAVAVVLAVTAARPSDAPTFWGYLITTLLVLPVAAAWAFAERTRWSSVVLAMAGLTVGFLHLRMWQVWWA